MGLKKRSQRNNGVADASLNASSWIRKNTADTAEAVACVSEEAVSTSEAAAIGVPVVRGGEEWFYCPKGCGRMYKNVTNMKKHLKFECGSAKQLMCHHCGRKFYQKLCLKKHILCVHANIAKEFFYCPNGCGRKYKHKGNVANHVKYECGVPRQFLCQHCNKDFTHKSNLKRHIELVHRKLVEKWWYCPNKCGQKYKQKETLQVHVNYECSSPKQFTCHYCEKVCSYKSNLKEHILFVHSKHVEKWWECPKKCGRKYKYKKNMISHAKYKCLVIN